MSNKLSANEYLTVKELRELLEGLDDDLPVILQQDAEGNGYRLGYGGEQAYYQEKSSWHGEVMEYDELTAWELTADDVVPCFVIHPIN